MAKTVKGKEPKVKVTQVKKNTPVAKEYIEINNPEETIIEPIKEVVTPIVELNYQVTHLEGGMCKLEYTDGSSETITANEYESRVANGEIAKKGIVINANPIFKSKEESDLEAHYASLGQIEYYLKHVKK